MTDRVLDLRGLKCPLPALHTRKALRNAEPGMLVRVECTDPLARIDIPNLVRETRDVLESVSEADGFVVFGIRKSRGEP